MFADTLFAAERFHLLRVLAWAALGVLAGTALLVVATARGRSALLRHFALQSLLWGAGELAGAGWAWRGLHYLDLAGAARLERLVWLQLGLWLGVAALGATLALAGWRLGRSLAAMGAGTAIAVQGAALAALTLAFVPVVSR